MERLASQKHFPYLVYGENADDVGDVRPGVQAAKAFQVKAPLKEIGMTKAEIRALSAQCGLPTAEKPQMACLSSRIPHGERVTPAKLSQVEEAEKFLKECGFFDVRVRHHEMQQGALARIEIGPSEFSRCLDESLRHQVVDALKALGYHQVTLDLRAYQRATLQAGNVGEREPIRS